MAKHGSGCLGPTITIPLLCGPLCAGDVPLEFYHKTNVTAAAIDCQYHKYN